MKARVFGFEWNLNGGVNLEEYLRYLQEISGQEITGRVIAVAEKPEYHAGLFLTIKDIRAYCKMQKEGGNFTVSAQELEEGSSMADFNFFVINTTTGRGLYQHYHQSAMPNTFCMFAKRQYMKIKHRKMNEEIEQGGGEEALTSRQLSEIKKRYKGCLDFSTLVRPGSFEMCVSAMNSISCFEFELSTITDQERAFAPLSRYAKKSYHKVHFINPSSPDSRRSITDFIRGNDLKRGKAHGFDENGNSTIYKLYNDYFSFDEYEYNDIVQTINIDSNNLIESLRNSFIINELLDLCGRREIAALLTTPIR